MRVVGSGEAHKAQRYSNKLKGAATMVDADMDRFGAVVKERAKINIPPHVSSSATAAEPMKETGKARL